MVLRFDIDYSTSTIDWNPLIDEVFSELSSSFLEMPRGDAFVDYLVFQTGYQTLKRATDAFSRITAETVLTAVREAPISFVVFRSILGLTPPEWAELTSETMATPIDQGAARTLDRKMRRRPLAPMEIGDSVAGWRIRAMVEAGVRLLEKGRGAVSSGLIHRLDKADTAEGFRSIQSTAYLGVPYPVLLYERFLGRPFATHRDSVSELVGEVVEVAIRDVLTEAKVSFRETTRAERVSGFDQVPDFIVPDEFAPAAVIEAKLTEDDGTARDKVARVQRLRTLRDEQGGDYDVIACIAGRGFRVRREDMRRLLQATDGRVFTLETIHLVVDHTRIRNYRIR